MFTVINLLPIDINNIVYAEVHRSLLRDADHEMWQLVGVDNGVSMFGMHRLYCCRQLLNRMIDSCIRRFSTKTKTMVRTEARLPYRYVYSKGGYQSYPIIEFMYIVP